MNFIIEIFNFTAIAYAQAEQGVPPQPGFADIFSKMMPMFAIVFMIFYFMVIKPQQSKLKSQETLLGSLKKGDEVVTSGGIIAKVFSVEEDCVVLDVSASSKIKVEKLNIVKRRETKQEKIKSAA